jgi:hypothetical protein
MGTGEGVRDAPEGIVWIDGAPYSDIISSTTSRHRGSDYVYALNIYFVGL